MLALICHVKSLTSNGRLSCGSQEKQNTNYLHVQK